MVGIDNNTDPYFKELDQMLGSDNELKRSYSECIVILIVRLMVPRLPRPPRFRHSVFHSLSKSRSRLRAQISRRGWQADVTSSRVTRPELLALRGHRSSGISSTSSRPPRIRTFTEPLLR